MVSKTGKPEKPDESLQFTVYYSTAPFGPPLTANPYSTQVSLLLPLRSRAQVFFLVSRHIGVGFPA